MTNKVNGLFKLSDYFVRKYFRANADLSQLEDKNDEVVTPTNQGFEVFDNKNQSFSPGINPSSPSPTAPLPGAFEVFEVKKKILPEFTKLTEEQQGKIIEELARIKARNHKP